MNGRTLTDIGKELRVSTERVRQLANKGMRLLRKNKKFIMSVADYITDDVDAYSRKPVVEIVLAKENQEQNKRRYELKYEEWKKQYSR